MIFLSVLAVLFTVLGMCFLSSAAVYEYHLSACESFILDICYSDTNVFLIYIERLGGCALLLVLILAGSVHPIALVLPLAVLIYRAFTFGGCLYVFFNYYGMTGAMIVFIIYLPIHLLTDVLLIFAAVTAFARSFRFCAADFSGLLFDALVLFLLAAVVYLAETILLLVLFHPIGKIL